MQTKKFMDLEKTSQNPTLGPIALGREVRSTFELYICDQDGKNGI